MVIKKTNAPKSIKMIVDDISYSFTKLTLQNNPILSITINGTGCKTKEELRFNITNKFSKLNRNAIKTFDIFNYLFIIEYPTKVSMGNLIPDNCIPHAHVILETSISVQRVKFLIEEIFKISDIYIKDITKRDDKNNYLNYLLKQSHLFDINSYNYKIKLPSK